MYPNSVTAARSALIQILQQAHAGELAAAHAYRGHAASWWARHERAEIAKIEAEEWQHRKCVAAMLVDLGAAPQPWREQIMGCIGSTIGLLCHLGGWLIPMYGAGRLEASNISEYEHAARLASLAAHPALIDALLEMGEVEWEHEQYFRKQVHTHRLGKHLPLWPAPPAKAHIRSSFADFLKEHGPSSLAALSLEQSEDPPHHKETSHA
jgi:hypothetical protein